MLWLSQVELSRKVFCHWYFAAVSQTSSGRMLSKWKHRMCFNPPFFLPEFGLVVFLFPLENKNKNFPVNRLKVLESTALSDHITHSLLK